MHRALESFFLNRWYASPPRPIWPLIPVSFAYAGGSSVYQWIQKNFYRWEPPVPLIVVGNLTLGGVGKTPLVAAIAHHLKTKGWKVGIISRGYGGASRATPHLIQPTDSAFDVGDEPLWLAETTACPVVVSASRVAAAQFLCNHLRCDVIISDDGLQHAALGRTLEIAVMDAARQLGNGWIFPAGPLRETAKRLQTVDLQVINEGQQSGAYAMKRFPVGFYALQSSHALLACHTFAGETVSAVTGIGDPQRFFNTLTALNIHWTPFVFPNHYRFTVADLQHIPSPIVMTDKDAVKCRIFAQKDWYRLASRVELEAGFWRDLDKKLLLCC